MANPLLESHLLMMGTHAPNALWGHVELSLLWSVFSKCKKNVQDLRIENISWRLWYRQAILRRPKAPHQPITLPSLPLLTRTRSLPTFPSQPRPNEISHDWIGAPKDDIESGPPRSKFYIDYEDLDSSSDEEDDFLYNEDWQTSDAYCSESLLAGSDLQDYGFEKKAGEPISLLSAMQDDEGPQASGMGLRRCQARYKHLSEWFMASPL